MTTPVHPSNVFLIGPMGAGKTTVGALLAKAMGREFLDSDTVLQEHTGVTVSEIFEREGEQGFRQRERKLIADLVQRRDIVLATGGGAVLDAENRRLLAARGTVIYLRVSLNIQLRHLHADRSRPLLQDGNPEEVLARLSAEREPLYRELCDYQVNMDSLTVRAACSSIVEWLDQPSGLS